MRRRIVLACALALGGAWWTPCVSFAQDAAVATQAEDLVPGEESPELRALRLAELEIFAGEQPAIVLGSLASPTGVVPQALTSDGPELADLVGASGSARDLSWLRGLTLPDIPVRWDDRVVRYLEFFRDDPRGRALIRGWMARVERYGPMIRQALRSQGMPEDLLYVAMIESGFDPRARSDAGAVGMWQFVARTGEEYGLTQDHWVDLRMDPERSTVAGARYLEQLHGRFGTWELAFAAYNMGYGGLLRAIRKYDTNDYWALSHLEAALPFETTLYVAKVTACAIVGRNLERFGLGDLAHDPSLAWQTVEVPGGSQISLVARAAGTTVEQIRTLNPSLRRDRVPPGHDAYAIRIPATAADTFAARWDRVRPRHPAHQPYVVRFGETFAQVAHRFATTERALRELNELDTSDEVHAGFALMVPAVTPHDDALPHDTVVAVPDAAFVYADRRRVFYRPSRSDRLSDIARFFAVTVEELRTWNNLDPSASLQDGMFLQLFVPASVDLSLAVVVTPDEVRVLVVGSEEFYEYQVLQEGRVRLRYRVQEGDTLSEIGERFGISVGSLCRINIVPRDAVLRVGQEIVVYTTPDHVPAEQPSDLDAEDEVAAETSAETATETATEDGAPATSAAETVEAVEGASEPSRPAETDG